MIPASVNGNLSCFYFCTTMNNTDMNTSFCVQECFHFSCVNTCFAKQLHCFAIVTIYSPHPYQSLLSSVFLIMIIPGSMKWNNTVVLFLFLWWLMMLNIFSCGCWPFLCLSGGHIYLNLLPIKIFLVLCHCLTQDHKDLCLCSIFFLEFYSFTLIVRSLILLFYF